MLGHYLARICVALCATLVVTTAAAQNSEPPPLTLDECVQRALQNNFGTRIAAQDYAIAREDIPIARSEFLPQLSASTGRYVTDYGQFVSDPTLPNSLVDTHTDQTLASIGLSQHLPTGTTISISADQYRLAVNPASSPLNPSYTSGVRLSIEQPLLKGFGSRAAMLPVRHAEATTALAQRVYQSRGLDVIESTELAFYALANARERLTVLEATLNLAQTLHEEIKARFESDMATHDVVMAAAAAAAEARVAFQTGKRIVSDRTDELFFQIGQSNLNAPLRPIVVEPMTTDIPREDASFDLAKQHSPVLQAQRDTLAVAGIAAARANDNLKLDLGLVAEVALAGTNRDSSNAFSDAFDRQGGDWQISLQAVYPIGRTAEHARVRQANAAVTRETLRVQELEEAIRIEVRSAMRAIITNRENVEVAKLAAEASELHYDAEKARLAEDVSTNTDVLNAQERLERARLTHAQARLDYFISRAALRRIEGSAFDHYNVPFPKPDSPQQ